MHKNALHIIVAALLLLVFLLTPVAEAFHSHTPAETGNAIAHYHSNTDQHQLKTYSFCKLCDYLQHIAHQQITLQAALPAIYLPATLIKYQSQVPCLIPALVLNYANKGPPTV